MSCRPTEPAKAYRWGSPPDTDIMDSQLRSRKQARISGRFRSSEQQARKRRGGGGWRGCGLPGAHLLAEDDAEAPFGLKSPVARIACETSEPVDDLVLTTDAGSRAYVQVKRTVDLSRQDGSALASAMDQFVRQFLDAREAAEGGQDPFGPMVSQLARVHARALGDALGG